jgi:hypothetical protein
VADVGGGVQAQARVPVLGVVPGEERRAARPCRLDQAEPGGNPGRYFRALNWASEYGLSLDTRGPGVRLDDAEVGEQERDRLGAHQGAAVL